MKQLILIIVMLGSFNVALAGKEVGNGGASNPLGFLDIALSVVADIDAEPAKYPEITAGLLQGLIYTTKVLVSEDPLFVDYGLIHQQVVAINYQNPNRIILHRLSWLALSESEKKAISFHELLGLAGIESTGDYHVSSRYFASNNFDLFDCWLSDNTKINEFTLSDPKNSWSKAYLDTIVNGVIVERVFVAMGPGMLEPSAPTSDSSYIQINRMTKGATDWENVQTTTFFGDPKLPRRFQLELDKTPPYGNPLTLHCQAIN